MAISKTYETKPNVISKPDTIKDDDGTTMFRNELGQFINGNKAAEQWNQEQVMELLFSALQLVKDNPENYKFIGKVWVDVGISKSTVFNWKNRFAGTPVRTMLENIHSQVEANLASAMLDGKAREISGIFVLKNCHGWKDKRDVEHVTKTNVDLSRLNESELAKYKELASKTTVQIPDNNA